MSKHWKRALALGILVGLVVPAVVVLTPAGTQAEEQVIDTSQMDATIVQSSPDGNSGGASNLNVRSEWMANERFLIQFDLSGLVIPPVNRIASAIMVVHPYPLQPAGENFDYPKTVEAHRVTAPWQEMTVTWNYQPTFEAAATEMIAGDELTFDLTSAVVGWHAGRFPNYGVVVKPTYEDGDAEGDDFAWYYCSRESEYLRPLCELPQLIVRHEPKRPYADEVVEVWYYYSSMHQTEQGPAYVYAQFEAMEGTYQRYRVDLESPDVPTASGPTWAIEVVVPTSWQIAEANGLPIVNLPNTVLIGTDPGRYPGTTSWFIDNTNPNDRLYAGITYHLWFLVP